MGGRKDSHSSRTDSTAIAGHPFGLEGVQTFEQRVSSTPKTISSMTNNNAQLIGAANGFEDGAERRRAEERLAAFSDLGLRLSAAVTEREAARAIATVAEQLFGWDACFLDSYSEEEDTIRTILCIDTLNGAKTDVALPPEAQRLSPWARQIIDSGPQLILRKAALKISNGAVPFGDQSRPSASLMAVPLRAGNKVIGVLSFQSYALNAYTADDLKMLQALAEHCHAAFARIRQAEDALQRSQQHLQALFDNALDAIFLADEEARFIDVNPATCLLSGYESSELLKMTVGDISVPEMRSRFPGLWQHFLARGRLNADYTILRKDGRTAEVEFRAIANVLPGLHMAAARDVTKRKCAEAVLRRIRTNLEKEVRQRTANLISINKQLADEIQQRKRLQHELLEITERERNRIGRDLHDDLGQQLSGLALMTKGLQVKLLRAGRPEAKEAEKIHSLIFRAINHAHDLAYDLASLELRERDLRPALMHLASHVRGLFKISCRFSSQGACPPLEEGVKAHLYKIAQEAVTNAIKHGKARRVWIRLAHSKGKLLLSLRNDGIPFSEEGLRSKSMGLRIMNYRASSIGGTLELKVNGRKQTVVSCCAPVH